MREKREIKKKREREKEGEGEGRKRERVKEGWMEKKEIAFTQPNLQFDPPSDSFASQLVCGWAVTRGNRVPICQPPFIPSLTFFSPLLSIYPPSPPPLSSILALLPALQPLWRERFPDRERDTALLCHCNVLAWSWGCMGLSSSVVWDDANECASR